MITSKLTSKAQTTIPQAVRSALGVKALATRIGELSTPDRGEVASGLPTLLSPVLQADERSADSPRATEP